MAELTDPDVAVLGAGIVGICSALFLQQEGLKVRLLDRDEPGTATSFGNAGILSPDSCVPMSLPGVWRSVPKWLFDPLGPLALRWAHLPALMPWLWRFFQAGQAENIDANADAHIALYHPTIELYRKLLQGTGHDNLIQDADYLYLYEDGSALRQDGLEWRLRIDRGADIDVISAGELQELEPDLAPRFERAMRIKGIARITNPGRLCRVLAEKFAAGGGEILRRTVHSLRPLSPTGAELVTTDRTLKCPRLVIAAGPWSATLLKPLGCKLPLEAERGYHVEFADPGVTLRNTVHEVGRRYGANSMETGLRIAGTAEFAGLDRQPDYRRADVLAGLAKRLLPKLNTATPQQWMGQRPSFPDSLPVIGPLPDHEGVVLAFGHGHLGMTGGAPTGRLVAQLVTGQRPNIDLKPYSARRF